MRNSLTLIIALLVIAIIEFYSFTAVKTILRGQSVIFRNTVLSIYVLLSVLVWAGTLFFRRLAEHAASDQLKAVLLTFLMGFMVGKLVMAIFMLFDDGRRLISWIYNSITANKESSQAVEIASGISRSAFMAKMALLAGGLLLGGFLYGPRNRYKYVIKRHKIPLDKLPSAFKGLKIVQISDVHSGSFDNKEAVAHGVSLILKEQPDLILFTGDLVNNVATEIEPYKDIFARLKAPLGVYSVLGNHDYGDYVSWPSEAAKRKNLDTLKQHHADMGWRLMMNEHVLLQKEDAQIALLGIENWGAKARFPKLGDMKKAYSGLENRSDLVKILMSHDPSHWDAQVRTEYRDIDLMLSGHTHGMQFGIRLPWMQWSPVQYMYKQWAGLYKEEKQHLYVNVGYGFLGYPGRLGILPEITVIELV